MINDRPTMPDLGNWLRYRARSAPGALALRDESEELTYADLLERMLGAREALAAEGLGEGAVIGSALPNSVEAVVCLYAIWDLGAVAAPSSAPGGSGTVDFEVCEPLTGHGEGKESGSATERCPGEVQPGRIATRIQTSGSLGKATAVELTHSNHIWSAMGSAANLGSYAADRWLCCLPLHHVSGVAQVHRALLAGGGLVLHDGFDTERVGASLREGEASLVSLVATQLRRLMDAGAEIGRPRAILAGGGPVPQTLISGAGEAGATVLRTYGLTEAGSQVATVPPGRRAQAGESCGPPLPTAQVRVVEDRIEVRGPTVAASAAGHDGWLRTDDLGSLDESGQLTVLGRADDLIVTGGENVRPEEVESSLSSHPAIAEAVVFGLPDEEWQSSVNAALVMGEGEEMPSVAELRAHCAQTLPGFKIPKRFVSVESLPRSEAGKPLRRIVAERVGGDGR